jgi:hypothetical protein
MILNATTPTISNEDKDTLTFKEFEETIFSMLADKCPLFYQHFWPLCGHVIYAVGFSWLVLCMMNFWQSVPNMLSSNVYKCVSIKYQEHDRRNIFSSVIFIRNV